MPILSLSPRSVRLVAFAASMVLPVTARAQVTAANAPTHPDPWLGIPLGAGRQPVGEFLAARSWIRVIDSVPGAIGTPSVFTGSIEGHPAEIVAMFGESTSRDRLINLVVNFPAVSDSALRSTYAWAFRRMEELRCKATLAPEPRARIDSLLAGRRIRMPNREDISVRPAVAPGRTTVDPGNLNWPTPTWVTRDGHIGTRLSAAALTSTSPWMYEVTVWSGTAWTVIGEPTTCADAGTSTPPTVRASAAAPTKAPAPAPTRMIPPAPATRTAAPPPKVAPNVVAKATPKVVPTVVAKAAPKVVAKDTSTANPLASVQPQARALYGLFRKHLTSSDVIGNYIDIECEMEHMFRAYGNAASKMIDDAQALAIDKVRDRKALSRADDLLAGHVFYGCTADRKANKRPK